jgi:hypothetical protein
MKAHQILYQYLYWFLRYRLFNFWSKTVVDYLVNKNVFRLSFCVVLPYEQENLLIILRHAKLEYDVKMNIT